MNREPFLPTNRDQALMREASTAWGHTDPRLVWPRKALAGDRVAQGYWKSMIAGIAWDLGYRTA